LSSVPKALSLPVSQAPCPPSGYEKLIAFAVEKDIGNKSGFPVFAINTGSYTMHADHGKFVNQRIFDSGSGKQIVRRVSQAPVADIEQPANNWYRSNSHRLGFGLRFELRFWGRFDDRQGGQRRWYRTIS
jgi:hypothetical protein